MRWLIQIACLLLLMGCDRRYQPEQVSTEPHQTTTKTVQEGTANQDVFNGDYKERFYMARGRLMDIEARALRTEPKDCYTWSEIEFILFGETQE